MESVQFIYKRKKAEIEEANQIIKLAEEAKHKKTVEIELEKYIKYIITRFELDYFSEKSTNEEVADVILKDTKIHIVNMAKDDIVSFSDIACSEKIDKWMGILAKKFNIHLKIGYDSERCEADMRVDKSLYIQIYLY